MVAFPHANGYEIADDDFRAAWNHLCALNPVVPPSNQLPRLPRRDAMTEMAAAEQQRSLEYLCRVLVPNGYKNAAQATQRFLEANAHIVRTTLAPVVNPATGRVVDGVELIGDGAPVVVPPYIEALFEADNYLDDDDEGNALPGVTAADATDDQWPAVGGVAIAGPIGPDSVSGFADEFVRYVQSDQFFACYRGATVAPGIVILGWDARRTAYFWPNPAVGLEANAVIIAPLLTTASRLAALVRNGTAWAPSDALAAVDLARAIFKWGGVPQKPTTITAANIRNVFEAALQVVIANGTLMNSGWTKVAAFATGDLPVASSHAIWDSRVSASVVRRLDAILVRQGFLSVPPLLSCIGLVNVGRGGNRPILPGQLRLTWRNGYKSWPCQIAGSEFLRAICVSLNAGVVHTARRGNWTVRDVEMVLFGDGY